MTLRVQISQARNLSRREKGVAPEAYCLLIFEKNKEKTTVSAASPQPFWDENFTFSVANPNPNSVFETEVYDKEPFGSEFLGKVSIPLWELSTGTPQGKWYELKDRGKKETRVGGEIRMIVGAEGLSEAQRSALLSGGKKEASGAGTGGPQKGYSKWDDNEPVPEKEKQTRANIVEAEELAKDQKEATRRMLSKLNETETVGANTLVTLQEQGEQIKRVQKAVDRVNDNTDEANDNIKQVDSFWYAVKTHFSKKKKKKRNTNAQIDDKLARDSAVKDEKIERNPDNNSLPVNHNKRANQTGLGPQHPKELEILSKDAQRDIQEADQNLDQMSGALNNLKRMASQMGTEVDGHIVRLDAVQKGVDDADRKVIQGNQKIDKILK
eukprot:TRINITY_DN1011_c0_g1_i1.p1 TRINITY_DN1011_c0_g1~~TRINITY_DN1011_c0_g1_i1.p1  ORF type:complete len:382 (-),score=100.38 TRINITY_DN1011_c0_g1_i1:88-1233(-)